MSGQLVEQWPQHPLIDFVQHKSGDSKIIKGKQSKVPKPNLVQGYSASGPDIWVPVAKYNQPGVVISAVGARCGKTFLAQGEWTPIANTHALISGPEINVRWLWYLTNNEDFWIRGGSAQPFVKVKATLMRPVAIPPLEEQQRIVSVLDEAFNKISNSVENTTQRLENANSVFQSILLNTFSRADDKWDERKLSTLCITDRGITYGVIKLGEHIDEGVPCLRTSNVKPLKIETTGMKKIALELSNQYVRTILRGGEVLVNVRGTLGGVASVPSEMIGWNVSREVAVVPVDTSIIDSDFLAYWIGSPKSQEWLTAMKKGAAYTGINLEDLRNLPVKFPDKQAQENIVKNLKNLSNQVVQIQELCSLELENYSELKQSILQEAFNGTLRIAEGLVDQS